MLSKKPREQSSGFGSWMRYAAIWIVLNIPVGALAPKLMGYALRSKPISSVSNVLKEF